MTNMQKVRSKQFSFSMLIWRKK